MNRDYNDLKDRVGKFNKIIVTGPHGAGNKIMTKILSKDFNLPEVRGEYAWDLNGYNKEDGIKTFHKNPPSGKRVWHLRIAL